MKRPYEVSVVLRILTNEDETQSAINQVIAYIEAGAGEDAKGKVTRVDRTSIGRKKLAYEIDKQRDGLFVIIYADLEPSHIAELDLNLRLYNSVLRHLIVRYEGEVKKVARPDRPEREGRFGDRDRGDRPERGDRDRGDRGPRPASAAPATAPAAAPAESAAVPADVPAADSAE
jgi:small subunit ribosomal protein S6